MLQKRFIGTQMKVVTLSPCFIKMVVDNDYSDTKLTLQVKYHKNGIEL